MVEHWTENPCVSGSIPLHNIANFFSMNNIMLQILISLKNAALSKKSFIKITINKKNIPLVKLLYNKGLIQSISIVQNDEKNSCNVFMVLYLRYFYNNSLLERIKIISSPTKKKILQLRDITRLSEVNNILFFSTVLGLKTLSECKKDKIGGIVLFKC